MLLITKSFLQSVSLMMCMRQENYLLRSFLANQKEYVYISGYCSEIKQVQCNSRQGSTLGPLVFIVYINNFQSIFSKSIVHKFADDNNLLLPSKKLGTIKSLMNHELKLLVQWLRNKRLFLLFLNKAVSELNIFKYPCKHQKNNYKFKLNHFFKCLSVLADEVLSWNKQNDKICYKLRGTRRGFRVS